MARLWNFIFIVLIGSLGSSGWAAPHWRALTEEDTHPSAEIIKEMLGRADMSAEFFNWPRARALKVAELKEHHFFFSVPKTPEHEKKFKWVGPLTKENFVVVALAGKAYEPVKDLKDLQKFRVGARQGSAEAYILESHGCPADKVAEDAQNLQKLKTGRIDFYITKPGHVRHLEKEGFKFKTILNIENLNLYAAFHRKTPDHFISRFNNILERMKKDGTTEKILSKYAVMDEVKKNGP